MEYYKGSLLICPVVAMILVCWKGYRCGMMEYVKRILLTRG
jgi:hypothetical protein